ncbi:MAG: hypothetical protein V4739_17620 [Pseudomonadota bacterium]
MLKALFGDLGASKRSPSEEGDDGFAATAIMESLEPLEPPKAETSDPFSQEIRVSGSPAAAIREHFSTTRADAGPATQLIALIDPVRVWATLVIHTLSEACAQPIERLHLRDDVTSRTVATIERTTVVRHNTDQLKVIHADVRAPERDGAEIQMALMEHSHMTAIVVGPMQAHAIDALLSSLQTAASQAAWRCPTVLFMLPPNAAWIQQKIRAAVWPMALQVLVVEEPMTSASAVWNAIAAQWRLARAQQTWARDMLLARRDDAFDFTDTSSPSGLLPPAISGVAGPARMVVTPELPNAAGRPVSSHLKADQAQLALDKMSSMEGLLACALVNDETSQVMARDTRIGEEVDLDQTASACAQLMRAHRQSALLLGLSSVEEVTTSSGGRQVMLRPASRRPGFFMMALLDKQRTNMTLARLKLMELDKHLT